MTAQTLRPGQTAPPGIRQGDGGRPGPGQEGQHVDLDGPGRGRRPTVRQQIGPAGTADEQKIGGQSGVTHRAPQGVRHGKPQVDGRPAEGDPEAATGRPWRAVRLPGAAHSPHPTGTDGTRTSDWELGQKGVILVLVNMGVSD